ncbi:MIF4-like, type 1/2/3 [Metarhizium album ARSEF 1941]|uniref:MIF4-like, type 1/2/3 n=1 Tax=Metarhizium album (strain ARSEF 1941) TaxID=1081103 RepID=A0A0B2X523_METAS|nr:MIF4-like, type 1/2/3 [Metarhizium album ARSEF 1941]KHO00833.1 MIF4-like, type 1/2/3 [Metarhizium album ARSEF 1941]
MTSPANQQNPIPAPNTSATTATSYASAAGAPKRPVQTPLVATGSQPPVVVGSSSASLAQNANTSSPSPVNGKPAVAPAVPAVARGSSTNGAGADHSRKSSVTMAANGPNSFAANGGAKPGIQFGFDSPAMAHSTPHAGNAAPIPIPGAGTHRVPSPAHSPSPIPQPSASGGRPPSGLPASAQMTFGSLSSDGERHMRQGSVPPNSNAMGAQPGAHYRRESSHSVQGDNRSNFPPQGGRGRGFNPHNQFSNQMGYPPNNQFRNGPGQGRGMPPSFQPQPRNMPYPNSPQPARSPALVPSMPNTPSMPPATMQPNMTTGTSPQYHYPPPPMAPQHQQVQAPFSDVSDKLHFKSFKKSKARRDHAKSLQSGRPLDPIRELRGSDPSQPQRRLHQRPEQQWRDHDVGRARGDVSGGGAGSAVQYHNHVHSHAAPLPLPKFLPQDASPLDLSPESGGFELWLTRKHQNYGYPPSQIDQYGRPVPIPYAYNSVPPYMPPPQTNSPAYSQQFAPPYASQQSHSMSRTPSQPERPSSASQQSQPLVVGSCQPPNAPGKPGPNNFVKPRKSAAIQIKNAAGEVVDTSTFKQPVSPAPTGQQSKTPPAVASTPTPPPKSSTPSAHGRSESTATPKTAKEIQDELKEKIKQATQGAAVSEAKNREQTATKSKVPSDSPAEKDAAVAATSPAEVDEPSKAEEEKKPGEPVPGSGDPAEDEEFERMIREMEEADAKREKEEEEYRKRAEAKKAEQKKKDEESRKAKAAEEDRRLREREREMERLEDERERRRKEAEASGKTMSVAEMLAATRTSKDGDDAANVSSVADKPPGVKTAEEKAGGDAAGQKRSAKPAALNLAPLNTKPVDPPQPSAALQSLKSSRFLQVMDQDIYPSGINSPNPALNAAAAKKGKSFKYDAAFLLQFQKVFTEQPSVEFHQQVKSLIGDGDRSARAQTPRQPSNRSSNAFPMGTFNAPPGRTLPSGTTSEQRMAMSSGAMPRPPVGSIGSFRGPGGGFPGTAMSRTSSQSRGAGPNSPGGRQSSRSTRGSRRDFNTKEAQAAKTMPLTAGQEIKPIAITANGWKPSSVGIKAAAPAASSSGYLDPEMVQRKVKAALNKMTPEKFDKIADQILAIAGQSKDEADGRTLRQVIQLTFEKATDEAHWASMYAKFCKRMLENMSADVRDERIKDKNGNIVSGGNLFRKYLLNRCQEEFERGWASNLPQPKEEEGGEDAPKKTLGDTTMLSDEYYEAAAAKRRGLGLVQFIGELYKLGMLTERIMHECVHKLVDYKGVPDEAETESLSKLLCTIGANLDATEKGRPLMDVYFQRIQTMIDLPELQSRLKFMLMDIIDLRKANWVSKEANKGPKTLEEVRAEAEAQAAKAQESARSNTRGGPGRPAVGRGDARNFSGGSVQQTSNQVGMDDLRRLKGSAGRTSSQNLTFGPSSMLTSRSNSGRRLGPGGSLGRPGEDSGASSRTGTPPTRDSTSNTNAFSLLANMVDAEHPASPPSAGPSPLLAKAVPDSGKNEGE